MRYLPLTSIECSRQGTKFYDFSARCSCCRVAPWHMPVGKTMQQWTYCPWYWLLFALALDKMFCLNSPLLVAEDMIHKCTMQLTLVHHCNGSLFPSTKLPTPAACMHGSESMRSTEVTGAAGGVAIMELEFRGPFFSTSYSKSHHKVYTMSCMDVIATDCQTSHRAICYRPILPAQVTQELHPPNRALCVPDLWTISACPLSTFQ